MADRFDAIIIGAGAAGLLCAGIAGQRGLKVLLLDHAAKVAEKIRISGGGRCNFTNRVTTADNFLSENPDFARSALARYTPADFVGLLRRHRVAWHEKHKGQLFCDNSSDDVIAMLLRECDAGAVARWQPCAVHAVRRQAQGYEVDTSMGTVVARNVVVATGGLSIPKIGASDFGYRLARQFGLALVEPRPALVPLIFDEATWRPFADLAGLSCEVRITAGDKPRASFTEDLLFTHRGLSGPAALQASSYWRPGQALHIALADAHGLKLALLAAKSTSKRQVGNELASHLPQRLGNAWLAALGIDAGLPLAAVRDRDLARLTESLARWEPTPSGSEGWRKAEVTAGGVDTRELSSQTFESRRAPGLHFIGEVVDVTGWLGGYNFQWAWASAVACARGLGPAGP